MTALYNSNLELTVLSCLFKDGSLFQIVEDILTKKSFKFPAHGFIFQTFQSIVESDLFPDVTTVATVLEQKNMLQSLVLENGISGIDALRFIEKMEVNLDGLESYAIQIQELYANRQLLQVALDIEQKVNSGEKPYSTLEHIDNQTGKISAYIGSRSSDVKVASDIALSSVALYEETRKGNKRFIETGLKAWDSVTNGFVPQRLYMIASRSGMGKSALAQNFVKLLSIDKHIKTHMFSFEMSSQDLLNRFVQILTGISTLDIERGELKEHQIPLYEEAISRISKGTFTVDDSPELTLPLLRTKVRKAVAQGAQLIIIDQLENLRIGNLDNQAEYIKLNYMAYRIKALARENDIPILLIHQLNRGAEQKDGNTNIKKDPDMSMLAQAGERPCNVVMMLRTDYDPAFFFVKNREGRKTRTDVDWIGERITFKDKGEIFPDKLL